jgi:chorismate mutase
VSEESKYFLVDAKVLPQALHKVVRAKQLLAQGKAANLSEATRLAGISRSAFYKYKDCVFAYTDRNPRRLATLWAELVDEPGVLSSLLATLSSQGGNILTINQNIPVDGVAPVSISLRCENMQQGIDEVIGQLEQMYGIVNIRMLAD